MNINKELIMKHLLTICCAVSVLLLLLPFATVTADVEMDVGIASASASASTSVSGFDAAFGEGSTVVAWLMLICPIVLVAMNYIKQLDKFKNILALVLPAVSLIAAIASLFLIGAPSASAGGASVDISTSPSIGFFLLIVAYIGTFVAGAMTFYGLKLSKDGVADFANQFKK